MDYNALVQNFPGYKGWGQAEAMADFNATGGSGKGGQSQDPLAQAREFNKFQIEANQPAINSLQSSIPETQQKFGVERSRLQGEVDPLKARYQSILDDLKGRETGAVNAQTRVTANEIGRRGIPLSSNIAEQEMVNTTNPIRSQYATLSRDTGLAREDSLRNIQNAIAALAPQETEATRAIQNAIAALQTGNPASSIQGALSYIGQQQQSSQAAAQLALQKEQLAAQTAGQNADRGYQQQVYQNIQLPQALAQIASLNSQIAKRSSSSGYGADEWEAI